MSRILVDLTDIQTWGGQHGGTQRVVYGIAKYFFLEAETLDDEIVFIAFASQDKTFHKTSFKPIYDRVESLKSSAVSTTIEPYIPLKIRLKRRLRPYVPEAIRKNDTAKKIVFRSYIVATKTVKTAQLRIKNRVVNTGVATAECIEFATDDTVLILGKPWDNLDIQRLLTDEKSKISFKLIQVVYDLIICLNPQLHHPSLFKQYTQHMFEAISASDLLLPISKSTEKDLKTLCEKLNLVCPPTKVIRLGDEANIIADRIDQVPVIAGDFIACVGTIEIRKNHILLYNTYKLADERGITLPKLLIVGGRGWLSGDVQYLIDHDPQIKEKILIMDGINDLALDWIYKNCLFTVYPSMYEGWGLPVAEALAYGKVCVASSASSIPEIGGELVDYFSPYNAEECLALLVKYSNKSIRHSGQRQICEQYKTTSWESTFHQALGSVRGV